MLRFIIASAVAATVLLWSASDGWAQGSGSPYGGPPASAIPAPKLSPATPPTTAIPNAVERSPTAFTGPATNTSPRFRARYVRPYPSPYSSYSPNSTWANRSADLVKPVEGFNSEVGTTVFNGYPPSYYAGFVTTGLPTYLTSREYPTVYGAYQYNGVMWAGPGSNTEMASVSQRPWSTYPNTTYSPVSPPTEVAFSHFSQGYEVSPGSTGLKGPANLTASGPAIIDIHVPSYGDVWIQGVKMTQSGELRRFISPTLDPHQMYSYDITARWIGKDGNPVVLDRRIIVKPGDHEAVDFVPPKQSILRTRELP